MSRLLVADTNRDVAVTLDDACATTFRPCAEAAKRRRLVHFNCRDFQFVDICAVIVLCVGDRRLQNFFHDARAFLRRERQCLDRLDSWSGSGMRSNIKARGRASSPVLISRSIAIGEVDPTTRHRPKSR